ncbi:O-antigen ligase family protein [Pseudoalteromonas sp. C2R02]|nr:O-antigen ligase family protein [Pseudoalteromonas sp. C2R02]
MGLFNKKTPESRSLKTTILYCLCFLLVWLPIPLGSYRPWAILLFSFFISVIFLLHLILSIKKQKKLFPPKYSLWVIVPLTCVSNLLLIQLIPGLNTSLSGGLSVISIDPIQTQITLLKTITMLLFSWLLFSYCDHYKALVKIVYSIVLGGLIQALYATFLNLNPGLSSLVFNYPFEPRATGSFSYQNFLANYLAICLSIGMGLLISQLSLVNSQKNLKNNIRDIVSIILSSKMLLRGALILMIIALILTRSRMGNSAFFIALAIVSIFSFFFYNKKPVSLRPLIISFFIIDIVIVGALFGVDKVHERLSQTSLESETRDEVIRDSIPIIVDNFFLGTGGGTFYTAFPKYQAEVYSGNYDNAHNDYIQFSIEFGVPMTLTLGGIILIALFISFKTMMKRKTPLYQGVSFGCAVAIIYMLLHSTVDYSLQAGANSFTFILILCLVFITAKLPREHKKDTIKTSLH